MNCECVNVKQMINIVNEKKKEYEKGGIFLYAKNEPKIRFKSHFTGYEYKQDQKGDQKSQKPSPGGRKEEGKKEEKVKVKCEQICGIVAKKEPNRANRQSEVTTQRSPK